jgi:hypothetical protein
LAYWDVGDHAIDELGGELTHPPATTGRTEASLATEGHDHFGLALLAFDVNTPVRGPAALQVRAELANDEGR